MHKKAVPDVAPTGLNAMVEPPYTNNVFNAYVVSGPLSGRPNITVGHAGSIGLNSGLLRTAPFAYSVNCPATAALLWDASKSTGWSRFLRNRLTIPRHNI